MRLEEDFIRVNFPSLLNAGSLLKTAFSDQPQTIYCAEIEGCGLDYPAKLYFDKKTNHFFPWILKLLTCIGLIV